MIDLLGKRYYFFLLSAILIIPGILIMIFEGLNLSIDFKGGTLLEVSFASGQLPSTEAMKNLYDSFNITDSQITTTGTGTMIIRSSAVSDQSRPLIITKMEETFKDKVTILRFDTVGPTISKQVTTRAILAIGLAALAVILYITFAFRGIPHAFRYGVCAIIAEIHDVLIVLSLVAIGGKFFGWQADSLFLTAVLTVIGFSVQDMIVVFDRIRENRNIYRNLPFETLANHSIVQTLQRSINTQLMTVEFLLLSLALFGGVTLREFCIILLVGMISGTYSSIFVAAPILVVWETKEWKTWFKRGKTAAA